MQDAWLDMFLLRIEDRCKNSDYVQVLARKIDLYKFIQLDLDARNAGTIDPDLDVRLAWRRELFIGTLELPCPPSPVLPFISSAKELLQKSLTQQHENQPKANMLSLRHTAEGSSQIFSCCGRSRQEIRSFRLWRIDPLAFRKSIQNLFTDL